MTTIDKIKKMNKQTVYITKNKIMSTTNFNKQVVKDIEFVKELLPVHYYVGEDKKLGSIHCKSKIGIPKQTYRSSSGVLISDAEWNYFFIRIRQHFKDRFQEVYHNTCFCHVDFIIYLKPKN